MMSTRFRVAVWFIIATIILIISLSLWIVFPLLYPPLVKKNLILSIGDDGRLSRSAYFWSKPPMNNIMDFYYFNVTNVDEIVYNGAKPIILQVGPFAIRETEEKRDIEFRDNDETVFYRNYKTYFYEPELSCEQCADGGTLMLPNGPALGAVASMVDPRYGCESVCRTLIDIGMLLLGESPFRAVNFMEVTFTGYDDPFLSFAHSELYKDLGNIFNNGSPIFPIPIPKMERMAFFYGYNNSNDESYVIKTGKGNVDNIGEVLQWAGASVLSSSWWSTPQARMINGSDAASFNKPYIDRDTVIPFFHSFMCRSFYAVYANDSNIRGIPSYTFEVPTETYDTTLDENAGFRYRNVEKIDYFPDWNPCPNKTSKSSLNCSDLPYVDCSKKDNFCHDCCDGKFVDGTYLLPPGIFPLVCYPGKNETPPFAAMLSPPHWFYSPNEAINSVYGLDPSKEKHTPFALDRELKSGMTTQYRFRMMVSMPIFRNPQATTAANLMSAIIPMFWIDSHTLLKDHMYNTMYNSFVLLPKAIDISKIVTLAAALLTFVIAFWCLFKSRGGQMMQRSKTAHQNGAHSGINAIGDDKEKDPPRNSNGSANELSGS